jgi:hypothetical protein
MSPFGGCAMYRSLYRNSVTLLFSIACLLFAANVAFAQEHSAHWYNKDAHTGNFSAILNVPDGMEAIVAVAREKGVDTLVGAINELTYQRKILSCTPPFCWPPLILLGIDLDMNGKYEADDYAWQWSLLTPPADPRLLHGDTFIQCEAQAPAGGPDGAFVLENVYDLYRCYSPNITGTAYANYDPLVLYQAGLTAPLTGITSLHHILAIKAHAGGSVNWLNFNGLLDRVTMGGSTRIDEPNNSRSHFEVMTAH